MPPVRLVAPEDLSLGVILKATCVRASDGIISAEVWSNSNPPPHAQELFVAVPMVTDKFVRAVRCRVARLLFDTAES